jgi:hypothetical protein
MLLEQREHDIEIIDKPVIEGQNNIEFVLLITGEVAALQ